MLKINILSSTKFHVLPLAIELQRQGADVRFYSYLPTSSTRKEGLRKGTGVSLFWMAAPFLLLQKLFPSQRVRISLLLYKLMDAYCNRFMRRADFVIALGSVYYKVLNRAKKDGAISILEWGSKHIIEQRKCFNRPDSYHPSLLKRELESYDMADFIAIGSQQVADTFIMHGIPVTKLLVNPYGVDLTEFPPTQLYMKEQFDLIYVGGWRHEKGSDLLIRLCEKFGYSLLHVGGIVNLDFPNIKNMTHVDPVPQSELTNYYKRAKVFVLPSRADGFGMVMTQAVGSGLPVVCSKETGGRDLRGLIDDKKWMIEMNELTVEELKRCVDLALKLASGQEGIRDYTSKEKLTWESYGDRYMNNLLKIKKQQ